MGRPSKLKPGQWNEISRRLKEGETTRGLAREFDIAEASVRRRFSAQHKRVRTVATKLVDAETALRELPVVDQLEALNLADELRNISIHLASTARYGAATAQQLASMAHGKVLRIGPLTARGSLEKLQRVSALIRMSNDAAAVGLSLMQATKHVPPPPPDDDMTDEQLRLKLRRLGIVVELPTVSDV